MKTIWKYEINSPLGDPFYVEMPDDAMPVHVDVRQNREPVMWAEVDTEKGHVRRRFVMIGTGQPIEFPSVYIGTCQAAGGMLVLHLFEVPERM